jgi:pepF/M3 family oligoendopeptidase
LKGLEDTELPHWDLTSVFPSLESDAFIRAMEELANKVDRLTEHLGTIDSSREGDTPRRTDEIAWIINGYLDGMNETLMLFEDLDSYLYALIATDSHNAAARRRMSEVEILGSRIRMLKSRFQSWLGRLGTLVDEIVSFGGSAREHEFHLRELVEQSKYLMSDKEESLAEELAPSSELAWERLQSTICSQVTVAFSDDGNTEKLPIAQVQSIRCHDPDRSTRQQAFEAEIEAWRKVREPLAAALNGVTGSVATLNTRRGREDALHSCLDKSRISRRTLESLMDVMRESFPIFRKYMMKKAERLGQEKLAWWDLFAPVSDSTRKFSFDEAGEFIVGHFNGFSDRLGAYAEKCFEKKWIDAEPREGKQGGAFCLEFPMAEESRVLCNFDGSLEEVITLAHELGHAYHCECLIGTTVLQRVTPVTLDETASVFCETVVTDALLNQASSKQDELTILEAFLIDATQTIVDISSRFIFEKEVFERREKAELSADDFCEMMVRAQKETYGEALEERHLHPYMWAWKPHYYGPHNSFYNYPYAFGLLFSLGLYSVYKQRGESFLADYYKLLAGMGQANTTDLALGFGIDIREPGFWRESMNVVEQRVNRYLEI